MRQFFQELRDFFRKGDLVLLLLCLMVTAFGLLIIASATNHMGYGRFVIIQIVAAGLGVGFYILMSSIDLDVFFEHRMTLVLFNTFLLLLLVPFGTDNGSGNRSWLDFPFLPVNIQPAEICKITYILIMASVMSSHQNLLSTIPSIMHMVFHLGLLVGLNMILSSDLGVSLIFVFIFIGMAWAGGVHSGWFLLAGGAIVVAAPVLWNFLSPYQQERFEILWNPNVDPLGLDARYQINRTLRSLTGGGLTGQGLFQGLRTQSGYLPAQHTDAIIATIGEEMGFLGCLLVILLLLTIVIRCIYVGIRTPDFSRRLVCFGAAAALMFQIFVNVGMNIGHVPIIGLTLPFISYGGSSIVTIYAMLGLVSGVKARPAPGKQGTYIQPPR